jgi:hypothetical protein
MPAGHVDDVLRGGGGAAGLLVDGHELPADLVLNTSGRSARAADDLRRLEKGARSVLCVPSLPS